MKRNIAYVVFAACLLGCAVMHIVAGCSSVPKTVVSTARASLMQMGTVWVDATDRAVIVSGFVNQVSGPVELLACGPGGKVHESAFVLQANMTDIQAAILLIGIKNGEPMELLGKSPPRGDGILLSVEWKEGDRNRVLPAEYFLRDISNRKRAKHGAWIFNGSKIEEGQFMAEMEQSVVATYWDPWAIINLASPDLGTDDERLAINTDTIPPRFTDIRMVIRRAGK
jgi:hypothetical protein